MGKAAFILGVVASVVTGVILSSRLIHRDYSASVVVTSPGHTCPTLGVNFDKPPEALPAEVTACGCPTQAVIEGGATPIHPPQELVAASAPLDQLTISYTEFTSPLGKKKNTGLSFTLLKGANSQTWVVSSPWPAYTSFATVTIAPFLAGTVLAILLTFLPKKNKGTASFS